MLLSDCEEDEEVQVDGEGIEKKEVPLMS